MPARAELGAYGKTAFPTERNIHPNRSPIVDGDIRRYRFADLDRNYFPVGW